VPRRARPAPSVTLAARSCASGQSKPTRVRHLSPTRCARVSAGRLVRHAAEHAAVLRLHVMRSVALIRWAPSFAGLLFLASLASRRRTHGCWRTSLSR
jgi:hypothetical protein